MRETNIGRVVEEMNRIDDEEQDPMKKDYGKAIERANYKENIDQTGQIPEGYEQALTRVKAAQKLLTPKLLEQYPEAKAIYDKAIGQKLMERKETFAGIDKGYQLTVPEMKLMLGEKGFDEYKKAMDVVSTHIGLTFPGLTETLGTNEEYGDVPMYGIRSALLGQYKGEERTQENVQKDIDKYSQEFDIPKKKVQYGTPFKM